MSFVDVDTDQWSDGVATPNYFSKPGAGRDSDWSFARREAVSALLGPDQRMSNLTDEELDVLFEDLQRVRADRKGKTESRVFVGDDDQDSSSSYPVREKYASNGTLDNFSLDTALTIPTTPQIDEEDERLRFVREELQTQLERQKDEYQARLKSAEESNVEIEEIRAEKAKMEESLLAVREDMQKQLQAQKDDFERQRRELAEQKEEYERQLSELRQPIEPTLPESSGSTALLPQQKEQARIALNRWQQRRYVAMAETILQSAATLKEAQVMSQQMDKHVVFQFCIVDVGHTTVSSYDLVLNDVSGEGDEDLDMAPKPCVAVRVVDFKHHVVHVWSLPKLRKRLRLMHQMHQYLNHPNYSQHFRLENPFSEACLPTYTRVGDADVPLAAVFEARVQDYTLDVVSPYTSSVVGIIRLSLEPSSAEAPSSTLKFNVVMHDMVGFPEREGTDVHAQLFVPGFSDESGATTTQLIADFDESPIRFESVHSMSMPLEGPHNVSLRVAIFARVTSTHLDKLLSWDDMRDSARRPKMKRNNTRLPESAFYTEERHDVFTKVQIQEISEEGDYQPAEVVQQGAVDAGAFQLHQGLQRRVVVSLTHSSGEALEWKRVASLRITDVRLLDSSGTVSDLQTAQAEVPLKLVKPPAVVDNADGTTNVTIIGQWDSSMHGSLLLDRSTAEKYRVQISLMWNVTCAKLAAPMVFSLDLCLQMRPRSYIRHQSIFSQLLILSRVVHSTVGIFSIEIRPTSAKRANDLWRMNTAHDYIKGEEALSGWVPRGVTLVQDFIGNRKRRRRIAEVEMARGIWGSKALSTTTNGSKYSNEPLTQQQEQLLRKVLSWWQTRKDVEDTLLIEENITPPKHGAALTTDADYAAQPTLIAEVRYIPKNPTLVKGSYLMMPDNTNTHWCRRYVEFRKPYLHIYSVPEGDELNAINLTNSRIDHEPQLAKLLKRPNMNIFAVFAPQNAYLFAARTERDKIEWILKIDQSYFSSGDGSQDEDDGYDD